MKSTELACVRVVAQHHGMDCLICCLAMLLGNSYEAALLAVSKVKTDMGTEGLFWTDAIRAAEQLGARLRVRQRYDPADTVGVVDLKPVKSRDPHGSHHAAFLLRGVIIDPNEPTVWDDYEVYEQANQYKLGAVLTQVAP